MLFCGVAVQMIKAPGLQGLGFQLVSTNQEAYVPRRERERETLGAVTTMRKVWR